MTPVRLQACCDRCDLKCESFVLYMIVYSVYLYVKSTYRESVRPTPAAASRVLAEQDAGMIDLDDPTHPGSRVALS